MVPGRSEPVGVLKPKLILNKGSCSVPTAFAGSTEISVGAILVWRGEDELRTLMIRVRQRGFEIPKEHVERGELGQEAAVRELREETGLLTDVRMGPELRVVTYNFKRKRGRIRKRVHYFIAHPA